MLGSTDEPVLTLSTPPTTQHDSHTFVRVVGQTVTNASLARGGGEGEEPMQEVVGTAASTGIGSLKEGSNTEKPVRGVSSMFGGKKQTVYFGYPSYLGVRRDVPLPSEPANKKVPMRFHFSEEANVYNACKNAFKRSGLLEATSKRNWNVRWGRHDVKGYSNMRWYQRINHFPGSWAMGRKDSLAKQWARARRNSPKDRVHEWDFLPETFNLPHERSYLEMKFKELPADYHGTSTASTPLWILKPPAASCGRGIKVVTKMSDIKPNKKLVVSRYISNPLLVHGCKFDLRMYVLVTSYDPLRIYLFDEGLVRFCTHKYSNKLSDLKKRFVHLTNYSVNKKSKYFVQNEDLESTEGSKWSLSALKKHFLETGMDWEGTHARMKDVIIKTIMTVETHVYQQLMELQVGTESCFELLGFDLLIDSNLKPWLMEVNVSPSLSSSSRMDKLIKVRLLADAMHLLGIPIANAKKPGPMKEIRKAKLRLTRVPQRFQRYFDAYRQSSVRDRIALRTSFNLRAQSAGGSPSPGGLRLRDHPRPAAPAAVNSSSSSASTTSSTPSFDKPFGPLLNMTAEDRRVLRMCEDEMSRCGGFERIFPTQETYFRYGPLFEDNRHYNVLIACWLAIPRSDALSLIARRPSTASSPKAKKKQQKKTLATSARRRTQKQRVLSSRHRKMRSRKTSKSNKPPVKRPQTSPARSEPSQPSASDLGTLPKEPQGRQPEQQEQQRHTQKQKQHLPPDARYTSAPSMYYDDDDSVPGHARPQQRQRAWNATPPSEDAAVDRKTSADSLLDDDSRAAAHWNNGQGDDFDDDQSDDDDEEEESSDEEEEDQGSDTNSGSEEEGKQPLIPHARPIVMARASAARNQTPSSLYSRYRGLVDGPSALDAVDSKSNASEGRFRGPSDRTQQQQQQQRPHQQSTERQRASTAESSESGAEHAVLRAGASMNVPSLGGRPSVQSEKRTVAGLPSASGVDPSGSDNRNHTRIRSVGRAVGGNVGAWQQQPYVRSVGAGGSASFSRSLQHGDETGLSGSVFTAHSIVYPASLSSTGRAQRRSQHRVHSAGGLTAGNATVGSFPSSISSGSQWNRHRNSRRRPGWGVRAASTRTNSASFNRWGAGRDSSLLGVDMYVNSKRL